MYFPSPKLILTHGSASAVMGPEVKGDPIMPKSDQETAAISLAKEHWHTYAGCNCTPKDAPPGRGYDLCCEHKRVEVKGTAKKRPSFRTLTNGEYEAAKASPLFELWLISVAKDGRGTFHKFGRDQILSEAIQVIHWRLPIRASRPKSSLKAAEKRGPGKKR
jgi:hypothetical protein